MSSLDETLISVVIPVYGSEQYIDQCIDSVVTQSHRNIEIICVNDGSPDRSGEICDRAADLDKRIRVVHQPNSGLVSARKAGVSIATGKL
jgi:glycosyltransferase involved in cell wall biosynthesis